MTNLELFQALGGISSEHLTGAEDLQKTPLVRTNRKMKMKRAVLIAAVIALALLLVGCAVVYALRLQDMSIGKETYTQQFADDGRAIEPTEKTRDIITLYGHSGDPIQLALTEWYHFLETYDPDGVLMDNNPDHPEIPNQYEYNYDCYTPEMVAKVDEIAAKYALKLLDEEIVFQAWQGDIFLQESGIGSLVLPESGAKISRISGSYYPPYNFSMDVELTTDNLDTKLWVTISYTRKDYFPRGFPSGKDISLFEQWDYTAPDGTPLLLALSNKGSAYIIAEPENAMLIYSIGGNFSGSAYPTADEVMTREQLESVAEVFDYSIRPKSMNRATVERQLEEAQAAYDAAHTYVPVTYGSFNDCLKADILIYDDALQYAFYDITGDGEEELLVGKNGAFDKWLTVQNGEVLTESYGETYVCEGGLLEKYGAFEIYEDHWYMTPNIPGEADTAWNTMIYLQRTRDQWTRTDQGDPNTSREITPEEAQTIMAQYPHVELKWMPLMEYPLSDNYTLGDYLKEKDVRVSSKELREIYRNYLLERESLDYSHYRILDINGDGVDDLLLKGENDSFIGNTDYYWIALTFRYGQIEGFAWDFYLCEDGVLENVGTRHDLGIGVEVTGHQFQRCIGFEKELLEFVAYNKATASWQGDWRNDVPITEEEANAILAKYPRIDQGMRPISELLG